MMRDSRAAAVVLSGVLLSLAGAPTPGRRQDAPADFVLVRKVQVAGAVAWTDSGLNVQKGQEYYFQAEGSVSLQKDNPIATCGPEGLALRTLQQPLLDQNLGALICKVREKVEFVEDKRGGEKTAAGRLLFRVNENVTDDNDGAFDVKIYLKREAK